MNEDLLPTDITIDQGKLDKRSDKKLGRNSSKRQLSDARQLGCVFQDMTPPKSILRKSTDMPKPIQRVKFKKAIARHTKIRDQNPSLGYICPGEPHERSPNAPKFEDRSREETEWQELGAREAAWKLTKNVLWKRGSLRSVKALVHRLGTLLNEQRRTIIAEYDEKVLHHEFLAAQAEQNRRILQEELLRQQQDFREVHQQDLMKQQELQKFQNSTLDEFTRQKFIEDQKIIMNYLEDFKNYRMK